MANRRFEVFRGNGIVATLVLDAIQNYDSVPPFEKAWLEEDSAEDAHVVVLTNTESARSIAYWVQGYLAGWEDSEEEDEEEEQPEG